MSPVVQGITIKLYLDVDYNWGIIEEFRAQTTPKHSVSLHYLKKKKTFNVLKLQILSLMLSFGINQILLRILLRKKKTENTRLLVYIPGIYTSLNMQCDVDWDCMTISLCILIQCVQTLRRLKQSPHAVSWEHLEAEKTMTNPSAVPLKSKAFQITFFSSFFAKHKRSLRTPSTFK